jgi:hypothetical protein
VCHDVVRALCGPGTFRGCHMYTGLADAWSLGRVTSSLLYSLTSLLWCFFVPLVCLLLSGWTTMWALVCTSRPQALSLMSGASPLATAQR